MALTRIPCGLTVLLKFFWLVLSFVFFFLFLGTARVKISYKFLLLSCGILFNLQTGDVKGAESSSSGRNVEWTCSRELVLHSGESASCWGSLDITWLEPLVRNVFKTSWESGFSDARWAFGLATAECCPLPLAELWRRQLEKLQWSSCRCQPFSRLLSSAWGLIVLILP